VQGFYRVLHHFRGGTQVPILIARNNEPLTLQLTLPVNFKPELLGQQSSQQKPPVIRDATIVTSTQLGWVLGIQNGMVTLVSVDATGPAGISGFQPGDEIVSVETHAVQTPAEVMDWIQRFNQNTSVTMAIRRGNMQLTRGLIFPSATPTAEPASGSTGAAGTVLDSTLQSLLRTQSEQARRIQDLQAQVDQLTQAVQQLRAP
jgi:C-terminal processing protease CtpA/Prc